MKKIIYILILLLFVQVPVYAKTDKKTKNPGKIKKTKKVGKIDMRNFSLGHVIPDEGYCDQPYIVITRDGNWLCVLTTGSGKEGSPGQHIVSTISSDKGKTWSKLTDIEPATGPEASWVVPVIVPYGRVYVFYTYNAENMREVKMFDGSFKKRVDTLGKMMFKYSDDNGRTWSQKRYEASMRTTRLDRENVYQGKIQFFWSVSKPVIVNNIFYQGFSKVGNFSSKGFMHSSEGYFLRSDNICTEKNPDKIKFLTLPESDIGLRSPSLSVSDEHNLVRLSDGSLFCMYRTVTGFPCHAYSRDNGRTWTPPAYATYNPGGRKIKHPRACPKLFKTKNNKFLFWFHNNHTKTYNNPPGTGSRNIAWITGGIEKNGYIHWSEPEILLYLDGALEGPSYPDLVEDNGRYYISATQKTVARVIEIPSDLLEGLWNQKKNKSVTTKGLLLDLKGNDCANKSKIKAPILPILHKVAKGHTVSRYIAHDDRNGFTIDLRINFSDLSPHQNILDTRDNSGKGFLVTLSDRQSIRFEMNDSWTTVFWECDRGLIKKNKDHHVVIIIDGGPNVISYVVDAQLNDGNEERLFGWGRFKETMRNINGAKEMKIGTSLHGTIKSLRIYNRYLRTSEAVANFNAGQANK